MTCDSSSWRTTCCSQRRWRWPSASTATRYGRQSVDPRDVTGPELFAACLRYGPEVVLLDLDLGPRFEGADLITPLTAAGVSVVVVTGSPDHAEWGDCLHRGAAAVVSKNAPLDEIREVVRLLARGLPGMPPARRQQLLDRWRATADRTDGDAERLGRLTPRERAVLDELADGRRIQEIAVADHVSEATVRTQVKAILTKLEVNSQLAAVSLLHQYLGRRQRLAEQPSARSRGLRQAAARAASARRASWTSRAWTARRTLGRRWSSCRAWPAASGRCGRWWSASQPLGSDSRTTRCQAE